jgi:hypothetical protein
MVHRTQVAAAVAGPRFGANPHGTCSGPANRLPMTEAEPKTAERDPPPALRSGTGSGDPQIPFAGD